MRLVAGDAHVKVRREAGCGRCNEPGGCGGIDRENAACQEYLVSNPVGARPGDRVLIEVPEGAALHAAAHAYLFPLAGLLAGALSASAMWPGDLSSAFGGLAGLVLALFYLRKRSSRQASRPRIAGVLPS